MSLRLRLRTMAAVLHQGRRLHALSFGMLGLAALGLLFGARAPTPSLVLACLSLVAGLAQLYFATRVDFDARLLEALAEQAHDAVTPDDDALAQRLDRSLQSLGLIAGEAAPRGWNARWLGMRRLLRGQLACLAMQAGLLAAAWTLAA